MGTSNLPDMENRGSGITARLDALPHACYDYGNPYCMVLEEGRRVSVQFNVFNWLFSDPVTAGSSLPSGEETFHYFWPWLIFCCAGLLICFYYWVEARKRFVKSKPLIKYMFDRYFNWLAIICFIGIPINLSRIALDQYFFAWRVWRYLWLLALVIWPYSGLSIWSGSILQSEQTMPPIRGAHNTFQSRVSARPRPPPASWHTTNHRPACRIKWCHS